MSPSATSIQLLNISRAGDSAVHSSQFCTTCRLAETLPSHSGIRWGEFGLTFPSPVSASLNHDLTKGKQGVPNHITARIDCCLFCQRLVRANMDGKPDIQACQAGLLRSLYSTPELLKPFLSLCPHCCLDSDAHLTKWI